MGEILIAGLASLLISIFLGPKYIQFLRGARVRPAHPRGGPGRAPPEGGHAHDGRARDLHGDRDPVPDPVRPRRGQHGGVRHRDRLRGDRLRRRLAEDRQGALAGAVGAGEARAPAGDRDRRCGWSRREVVGLSDTLQFRIFDGQVDIGGFYGVLVFLVLAGATNGVNLTDGLDGLAAGLRCDRAAHLHVDRVHHRRPGRPVDHRAGRALAARRVPGRRERRLPVVQLVPGGDLHGRHRLAGPRRRDRRHGGDDQVGGAADRDRRDIRDGGAVGRGHR